MISKAIIIFAMLAVYRVTAILTISPDSGGEYSLSPNNGKWYKPVQDKRNWEMAEGFCIQEGGHLAMPTSTEEAEYLKKLMQENLPDTTNIMVGFSKNEDGNLVSVRGLVLDAQYFQQWKNFSSHVQMMLGLKGGNCGSLNSDGELLRIACHVAAPFICERDDNNVIPDTTIPVETTTIPTTTTTVTTTTIPPMPAPGYEYITDLGWYKLYPKKKWHDALKACEEDKSHLAVINSAYEAQSLSRLMSRNRRINLGVCGCAFIGFHDLSGEGNFTTVFGEPLDSTGYVKWNYNNPDNTGNNEDCGSLTYNGLLNDLSCVEEYPFICESSDDTSRYNSEVNKNVTQPSGGYSTFPGVGSYKLHTTGLSWFKALDVCEKEDAYLAIVNSDQESDVLRKIIGRNPDLDLGESKAIFLGFHDIPTVGNFTTIFGIPLNNTGFTKWEQKSSTAYDCGGFTRNGRLTLINCFNEVPFICEKMTFDEKQKTLPAGETDSSRQFTFYEGLGHYKLHLEKANWYTAQKKCEQENAHLAIINSAEESNLLSRIISLNPRVKPHYFVLLGFHDISTEGRFVTVYGTPIEQTGFTNWREFNPDNFGDGEDCGAMDSTGLLNDVPCDFKSVYICERDLNSTENPTKFINKRRMRITPEHMHVRQGGHVSIICEAPEPLIECHFKMSPLPVMDLSRGSASKTNASLLSGTGLSNYRYNGTGLENGQCGVVLYLDYGLHRTTVGCRGRAARGGWYYAYMSLQASNSPAIRNVESPVKDVITFDGQPLKILWRVPSAINTCKCIFPFGNGEVILTDPNSSEQVYDNYDEYEEEMVMTTSDIELGPSTSLLHGVQYYGKGYSEGECGLDIHANKNWAGFIWCGIGMQLSFEWRSVSVVVVKPPSVPQLTLNAIEHSESAILEAECRVSGSVPRPNMTWYLDNKIIRQDTIDDLPSSTWSWPFDEQVVTQRLSWQLKMEDNGKELVCEAANPYSPTEPVRAKKVIQIAGSVLHRTFDVEEYGFKVGEPGFIVITITASPKPETMWHFDNVTVLEGKQDSTGRFTAMLTPKQASLNIQWIAKLYIAKVTEEDFSRDFHLTAKNEFGAQAYKVVIVRGRTTTEPPTTTTTTTTTTMTPSSTTRIITPTPTSFNWTTRGHVETTIASTLGDNYTRHHLEYSTDLPNFDEIAEKKGLDDTSGSVGGIIAGVVLVLIFLSVAVLFVYGRRVGWYFIPARARRHFGPAMSMDNLMDEEDRMH